MEEVNIERPTSNIEVEENKERLLLWPLLPVGRRGPRCRLDPLDSGCF